MPPQKSNAIPPDHVYWMSIQEAIMNVVLLCYFYGLNIRDQQKDQSSYEDQLVDGLFERPSVLVKTMF